MKDKELAKRLIAEAVEKHCLDYEGLYKAKDREKLTKDLYFKFLAGLISLENKRAFNNNGMCSACHTCQWDTLKFSENHQAIIF
jgi:hypothetical protein